jgi:N-acetylglutamate synthase-like GNAT family acetyltransferase
MIQVRKLQPQDLDYIFKNSESLGFDQKSMISKLENMMIVIDNNEICGIGFFNNFENKCILNCIYVKESHRRSRLGTMLVKTMLNLAEQQGALQAYIYGDCEAFSEFLGFQAVEDANEIDSIKTIYREVYNTNTSEIIYKVSLFDYFKPCSGNKKCM